MPERLLAAVEELTGTVKELESTLAHYPRREEVEDRFATKHESKRRAFKVLLIGLAIVFVSIVAAFFVTVGTIGTCFISDDARKGTAPNACHALPGYTESVEESIDLRKQVVLFLKNDQTELNSRRLDRIEEELDLPPLPN